ncbi:ComEC/Rec2 family competence protein [Natranaeroarchaeum aerophilus]|uniref:MBL fold metallo-hydrolase n=1 Tax=Natranaeroarchaeum aerophilus TaxID=2917711 RepID=A0AAE3FQA2_9EURY|nr:ComEC/Rec2 family competence protein [Natranaeroarchaeum aerophilus]MCL9813150.1 MBL fold metallo-hydrolase [Natranaeroarchaeum aerophilus]
MRRALLVVCVSLLLVTAGCVGDIPVDAADDEQTASLGDTEDEATEPLDDAVELHHIDVGQGDATLLIEPGGETMLIDTGDWRQDGEEVLAYLDEQDVERIDHLVATHGHADHIGGHEAVIDHYEQEGGGIGTAYDSGVAHTSQTYERYLDAIERHDVDLRLVEDGDSFAFGETTVEVYNPPAGDSGTDLHENSVALSVEIGGTSYLTTGDAERDAEQRMVDAHGDELDAEIYQAGHHGSSTSSTEPFLDAVEPEVAVISSALDSQYGHPHDEVMESFADRDIETYWTGVHGDVVVYTDGEETTVTAEHEETTDPDELVEHKPEDDSSAIAPPDTQAPVAPMIHR